MFPRTYRAAVARQLELQGKLEIRGFPRGVRRVAGADISYSRGSDRFHAAVIVLKWPGLEVIEEASAKGRSPFPYIPGLLSFREGPLLMRAFRRLKASPDLILFDGHGIAHPRGIGIASHLGLLLDIPSFGCGKSRLVGEHDEPGKERGERTPLELDGRRIGTVLRTRTGVKPVYISPGHRIGHAAAVSWALKLGDGYRLPAPTRVAHKRANELRLAAR